MRRLTAADQHRCGSGGEMKAIYTLALIIRAIQLFVISALKVYNAGVRNFVVAFPVGGAS